ncbi:MAG: OmpA family protein [Saprospiraceae bacterium]|nr:OmpA family protein [Saprospiraceae bacterium]
MGFRLVIIVGGLLIAHASLFAQKVDTSMHIRSIYFGGGSFYIDPIQEQELYNWLDSFPNIEQYEIIIQSHTDNIGSREFNQRLSEGRSRSVFHRLINYSLLPEAIEIKDFGEFLPTYRNDSYHGRLKNRRADVILKPLSL